MNFLFIHQNLSGQFVHTVRYLGHAGLGAWRGALQCI
jgi:hypothetical protein